MKLSLLWLKDYVNFDLSAEKLANRLTMAGLEVEKIEQYNHDTVFELEITPNRPDCLNILGLARETAAVLNKTLKYPLIGKVPASKKKVPIIIDDKVACLRYVGTIIEGVNVAASSGWISERINALGIRSINNVVDISNFCLMEMGQPLHAFDYDKLVGGKIIVRRAKEGEKIITLDGVERKLDPSILIIADQARPVAIAGIVGGKETEVTSKTKNILLESACFDSILIRRAARKLGLSSDSSYRFERGTDLHGTKQASDRAIALILKEAGGEVSAQTDLNYLKARAKKESILISLGQINSALGAELTKPYCKNILEKLECKVTVDAKGNFKVQPPSVRGDLKSGVDLVEEIGRVIGYDNLPASLPKITIGNVLENPKRLYRNKIREALLVAGCDEVVTYAMVDQKSLVKSGLEDLQGTRIQNPLSQEQEVMRPSNLPSLLAVVARNFNYGEKNLKLFEIGKIYKAGKEYECLGIVFTGRQNSDWRDGARKDLDFYDIKGAVVEVLNLFRVSEINFYPQQNTFLDASLQADCVVNNKPLGVIGKVSDKVLSAWDIKTKNLYYANLDLETLYSYIPKNNVKFKSILSFPAVVRDVSLAVKEDTTYQQLEHLINRMGNGLLTGVRFEELYLGDKIPSGYRGIVFSMNYQSPEKTLREDEVKTLHENIVDAIVQQFSAIRR